MIFMPFASLISAYKRSFPVQSVVKVRLIHVIKLNILILLHFVLPTFFSGIDHHQTKSHAIKLAMPTTCANSNCNFQRT